MNLSKILNLLRDQSSKEEAIFFSKDENEFKKYGYDYVSKVLSKNKNFQNDDIYTTRISPVLEKEQLLETCRRRIKGQLTEQVKKWLEQQIQLIEDSNQNTLIQTSVDTENARYSYLINIEKEMIVKYKKENT